MNTVGRRFKPESYENYFEDQLIKDLVDNSMNWEIGNQFIVISRNIVTNIYYLFPILLDSKNFLDHSMIKASMLTNQYVKSMKKWNTDFCDSLICNILEIQHTYLILNIYLHTCLFTYLYLFHNSYIHFGNEKKQKQPRYECGIIW